MPAPNDVQIVRVWTQKVGATVASNAFLNTDSFQVVVECEAGSAIAQGGNPWFIDICVIDLCSNTNLVNIQNQNGTMNWATGELTVRFTIPAPGAAHLNHICQVLAALRVRPVDPDTSFATSPLFIVI